MKRTLVALFGAIGVALHAETLVLAPGENETTNLTERLVGTFDVQVNRGASGGGIVNILNPYNAFVGSPAIMCGTLGVTSLQPAGNPSNLGTAPQTLTLGNGTFRYFGETASLSDMGLLLDSATPDGACVVRCDGDLTLRGPVDVTAGAFVKDGPGTLTIATQTRSIGKNMLSRSEGNRYYTYDSHQYVSTLAMNANGDAPTQGYGAITIREGRLAIDTPDAVTTVLGVDETVKGNDDICLLVGARSGATAEKSEPYGHLDIHSGTVQLNGGLKVGHYAGNETTRPDESSGSSVNVYGGNLSCRYQGTISVGYVQHYDDRPGCPSFNIYGGTVDTYYLQLAVNRGSRAKLLVAGGSLTGYGLYGAFDDGGTKSTDEYMPQVEVHVCSNGVMATRMIQPARNGRCDFTLKVTDGGTLCRPRAIATNVDYTNSPLKFIFDGGVLELSESGFDVFDAYFKMKLGAQASTIREMEAFTHVFPCPVTSLGESDGGLVLTGAAGSTVAFTGGMDITGPVEIADGICFKVGKDAKIGTLRAQGADVLLRFGWTGGAFAKLEAGELDVPGVVRVALDGGHSAGTYDLVSVPEGKAISANRFRLASDSDEMGATFGTRTENGRTIVTVSVAGRSLTSVSWNAPTGGAWSTGSNWNGGAAPADGADSRAVFAVAAAGANTEVTLDRAATLGGLVFSAVPGYSLVGSQTLTLFNAGSLAKVSVTAGEDSLACPVAARGSVAFGAADSATLTVNGPIAGDEVVVNPSSGDVGTVMFSGNNSFRGPLSVGNGTALFTSTAALGAASQIDVGNGTLAYAGEPTSLGQDIVFKPEGNRAAALSVAENSDVSLVGRIFNPAGFAVKTGKGGVVLDGSAADRFSNLSVQAGALSIPGDVSVSGGLSVGTMSAPVVAGADDAALVLDGGAIEVRGNLTMGYAQGGHAASLEVKSGSLAVAGDLDIGYQESGSAQTAEFVLQGGTVTVGRDIRIGRVAGTGLASKVEFTLNGGTLTTAENTYIGAVADSPAVTVNLNGGVFETVRNFRIANAPADGTVQVCHFNEGAVLRTAAITFAAGVQDKGLLAWDGGVWRVLAPGYNFSRVRVAVGIKGMQVDTSDAYDKAPVNFSGTFSTASGVETDGGLTVFSSRPATNATLPYVAFPSGETYGFNGPINLKSGGVLQAYSGSLAGKRVVVERNGALAAGCSGVDGGELSVGALELNDGASLILSISGASVGGKVRVTDGLSVGGTVYVGLAKGDAFTVDCTAGTYPVIRAPKGTLDASRFAISPRYARAAGTFSLDTANAGYDQVVFTLTSAEAKSKDFHDEFVWQGGSGTWTDGGKWSGGRPPADRTTDQLVIPAGTPDGTVIDLAGDRTLQAVRNEAEAEVSLVGGTLMMLGSSESAFISNQAGTLHLPDIYSYEWYNLYMDAAVGSTQSVDGAFSSVAKQVQVNTKMSPAGTVIIGKTADQSSGFAVKSGTLAVTPESAGLTKTTASNCTLEFLTSGCCQTPTISDAGDKGMNLRTDEDVYFTGKVTCSGPFVKTGKGTAFLGGADTVTLGSINRGNTDSADTAWRIPANGDLPTDGLGVFSLAGGKMVVGLDPRQTVNVRGRLDIGQNIADFDEDGNVLDSELEVVGGTLAIDGELNIGRTAGSYRQGLDSGSKRRNLTLTVRDGRVTFGGIYTAHDKTGYYNGTATLNVHGGTVVSSGGYVQFGSSRTTVGTEEGCSKTVINITGGLFTNTYANAKGHLETLPGYRGDLELNLRGGAFGWTSPFRCEGSTSGQRIRFNMLGGTFTAPYVSRVDAVSDIGWFWDGGTLQVTQDGNYFRRSTEAWTSNIVSAGGAVFSIPGSNVFTLNQAFTHDPDLGNEEDGGIIKRGTGTLVLEAANTCTGPCVVDEGEMKLSAVGAVNGGLVVNEAGYFNLNKKTLTVPYLRGNGGLVSNGTLTVTGQIATDSSVTVDRLVFGDEAILVYAEGTVLKVTSSAEGRLGVDFARTEATRLPKDFSAKIADLPRTGPVPSVYGLNTGWLPSRRSIVSEVRTDSQGNRELWVRLQSAGLCIIIGSNSGAASRDNPARPPASGAAVGKIVVAQDRADALYSVGEDATFTVTVTDDGGVPVRAGTATWTLDNFGTIEKGGGSVDLAQNNPFIVRGTMSEPGFLRLTVDAEKKKAVWGVGFDVDTIRQNEPCPNDFDSYWTAEKARLEREVPLDAQCVRDEKLSTQEYDAYRVSFATFGGKRVYGFLAVPTDKSRAPYRVRVTVPGAGLGYRSIRIVDPSEIRMIMNVHSFEAVETEEEQLRLMDEQNAALAKKYDLPNPGAYCAVAGIAESREDYYFHDVMLGINRAVDWVCARSDVDSSQVTYWGSSQGGGFGLFLNYLNDHFAKAFVAVCAMTGHYGYRQDRQNGWPNLILAQAEGKRSVAEQNAAYFDGVNFAARIHTPIRFLAGFADTTCPPHNVYAAYNVCPSSDKAILNAIGSPHDWDEWYGQHCGKDGCPDVDIWLRTPVAGQTM